MKNTFVNIMKNTAVATLDATKFVITTEAIAAVPTIAAGSVVNKIATGKFGIKQVAINYAKYAIITTAATATFTATSSLISETADAMRNSRDEEFESIINENRDDDFEEDEENEE